MITLFHLFMKRISQHKCSINKSNICHQSLKLLDYQYLPNLHPTFSILHMQQLKSYFLSKENIIIYTVILVFFHVQISPQCYVINVFNIEVIHIDNCSLFCSLLSFLTYSTSIICFCIVGIRFPKLLTSQNFDQEWIQACRCHW